MNLIEFKKIFDGRHEFENEDINVFLDRWSGVKCSNIPAAWILPLDQMLSQFRCCNPIVEIRQEFGQLVLINKEVTDKQQKMIDRAKRAIFLLDVDLHKELREDGSNRYDTTKRTS